MATLEALEVATVPEARKTPRVSYSTAGTTDSPRWIVWLFLPVWCGFLFFYGLGSGQLWKTEGLRAIVAAEFLRSGNWIVPTLYGEPLFTKPPGMYAAIALLSLPFGEVTEWSARLPSALAATLTVLMLYGYFACMFGRRGGLIVAILAPMSPLWLDKGTAAEIDMMQVMWVTGSILCLLRALEKVDGGRWTVDGARSDAERRGSAFPRGAWERDAFSSPSTVHRPPSTISSPTTNHRAPSTTAWWFAALLCVAGGVLTKWTAPAFFYATAIPLLWWRGQLRLLFGWRHLLAASVGASICLAWIVAAATSAGWEIFYETVKREALQRMLPSYAPHPDPLHVTLMHPLVLWYTCLPWSIVALLACRPGFGKLWNERGRLVWQGMLCWVWPNIVVWSLMLDHKSRHAFPLFPGFAGLAALVWIAWLEGKLAWRWRIQPKRLLVTALVCWMIAKLVFVHALVPRRQGRDLQSKAAVIASLVPHNAVLYLFMLKDEGIMFYYGRPVIRLGSPQELPSQSAPLYCILAQDEWERWRQQTSHDAVALTDGLTDSQNVPMVLVRVN